MYSVNKHLLKTQEFTFIEVIQKDIKVTFMDYGATIMSIFVPDSNGLMETVVMAYDSLESYVNNDMYLNAIIGPTSGRIQNAQFRINEKIYNLDKNFQGTENLHGGNECFAFRFFDYKIVDDEDQTKIIFTLTNLEEGSRYPGNKIIQIVYTVKEGELLIEFNAKTDKDTLLNLTNHAYFNLSGNMKSDILNHKLFVDSFEHISLNEHLVPIKIRENINTILDYRQLKTIKDNFYDGIYELPTKGIDHPYLLHRKTFDHLQIILKDDTSKRVLKVYTTYPCIVIYTHNYPNELDLLYGAPNKRHLGICFEAQLVPNGVNMPEIDSGILRKDDKYYHKTLFKFSVEE